MQENFSEFLDPGTTLLRARRLKNTYEPSGGERAESKIVVDLHKEKFAVLVAGNRHGHVVREQDPPTDRLALIADYLRATLLTLRYVVPVPAIIIAAWIVLCIALTLPQPWRAVAIWTEIILLCVGSVAGDPGRRR